MSSQIELTQIYKNALKAYNTQYDIDSEGTYWDVTSNATGGVANAVVVEATEIANAASPQGANSELLDKWLIDVGTVGRLSGIKASGLVTVNVSSSQDISSDDTFSYDGFDYKPITNYTVSTSQDISVQAVGTGAEYNLPSGTSMTYSGSATIDSSTSKGIGGGQAKESDSQVLTRIQAFEGNRKTDSTFVSYEQRGLEIFTYCQAEPIVTAGVIIEGVNIKVGNAIEDYDVAKAKLTINEISPNNDEIVAAKEYFLKYAGIYGIITIEALETQVIGSIGITVVNDEGTNELTTQELEEVKEAIRLAVLTFDGDVISKITLKPVFGSYIVNYVFEDSLLINRTSPQIDVLLSSIDVTIKNN